MTLQDDCLVCTMSFRAPVRHRRCIIPAGGLCEWRRQGAGKQPHFVRPAANEVLTLAGIWDDWKGQQVVALESAAIITNAANELMQPIHDRMPVVLEKEDVAGWLDPTNELATVLAMLKPCPPERMVTYPVSRVVNNARHDEPECVNKVDVEDQLY